MDIKVESQHVLSPSAMVIYWMSPATVVVYYFIASTISFCVLQKPSQNAASKPRRFALAALVAAVTLLFVRTHISVAHLHANTTKGSTRSRLHPLSNHHTWLVGTTNPRGKFL